MQDDQNKKSLDDLDLAFMANGPASPVNQQLDFGQNNSNQTNPLPGNNDDLDIFAPIHLPLTSAEPEVREEYKVEDVYNADSLTEAPKDFETNEVPAVEEKPQEKESDNAVLPKAKILLINQLLTNVKENTEQLARLISPYLTKDDEPRISIGQMADDGFLAAKPPIAGDEKIIEGVFDGEKMIGPDGKQYSVPANYASKSKLVEGDMMKLTITANGTFLYKQIGPVERGRIIGRLEKDPNGAHCVSKEGKSWRILTASVTYFRGEPGDEVIILVPKFGQSDWAAVENIIKLRS